MKMKLDIPTRMAIQAFFAVLIAAVLAYSFKWDRAYWAILTAILMISQTWGENVKRAFERISMTIVGGMVGTLLFLGVHQIVWLSFCILCLCVFFMVYFTEISYFITVFFVTIMLVFLFGAIRGWGFDVLWARILETIIGAAVALFVSFFIFPVRTKVNLTNEVLDYIDLIKKTCHDCFESVNSGQVAIDSLMKDRMSLVNKIIVIQNQVQAVRYELFYTYYSRKVFQQILIHIRLLTHYTTSMLESVRQLDTSLLTADIKVQLTGLQGILERNLTVFSHCLQHEKSKDSFASSAQVREKIWHLTEKLPVSHDDTFKQLAPILSLLYFTRKFNEQLKMVIALTH